MTSREYTSTAQTRIMKRQLSRSSPPLYAMHVSSITMLLLSISEPGTPYSHFLPRAETLIKRPMFHSHNPANAFISTCKFQITISQTTPQNDYTCPPANAPPCK